MNEHDRDNLEFLLNIQGKAFEDWYDQTDEDDRVYAQELLALAAEELREKALALRIEAELAVNEDYTLANQVIDKVR